MRGTIEIMNHHELQCRQAEVKLLANLSQRAKVALNGMHPQTQREAYQ